MWCGVVCCTVLWCAAPKVLVQTMGATPSCSVHSTCPSNSDCGFVSEVRSTLLINGGPDGLTCLLKGGGGRLHPRSANRSAFVFLSIPMWDGTWSHYNGKLAGAFLSLSRTRRALPQGSLDETCRPWTRTQTQQCMLPHTQFATHSTTTTTTRARMAMRPAPNSTCSKDRTHRLHGTRNNVFARAGGHFRRVRAQKVTCRNVFAGAGGHFYRVWAQKVTRKNLFAGASGHFQRLQVPKVTHKHVFAGASGHFQRVRAQKVTRKNVFALQRLPGHLQSRPPKLTKTQAVHFWGLNQQPTHPPPSPEMELWAGVGLVRTLGAPTRVVPGPCAVHAEIKRLPASLQAKLRGQQGAREQTLACVAALVAQITKMVPKDKRHQFR